MDNGEGCEPCVERALATGGRVAVCFPLRTWADAREDCVARGGDLVSARDAATWAAVRDAALTIGWQGLWIGLNDRETEGRFVWSDGTAVGFTGWSNGEPNDAGGNEDCVQLTPWSGGLWNDLDCGRKLAYVCSLPLATP
ncbi:MAG: C-type lectin domain-containing protein [Myxococcales bacterium]|nr:C-type lectin domain-containing protein [Myxococcales bacterium]